MSDREAAKAAYKVALLDRQRAGEKWKRETRNRWPIAKPESSTRAELDAFDRVLETQARLVEAETRFRASVLREMGVVDARRAGDE